MISKLDILKFVEREINRMNFDESVADEMKLEVAEMIKNGEITEDTHIDHTLFSPIFNKIMGAK